jgi:hypothetical protein
MYFIGFALFAFLWVVLNSIQTFIVITGKNFLQLPLGFVVAMMWVYIVKTIVFSDWYTAVAYAIGVSLGIVASTYLQNHLIKRNN